MYIHALVFLGCAGYVHYKDEHVRVDIFYRESSKEYKRKVNFILSFLFLIPICFVIAYYSFDLIEMAWRIREISTEPGGLKFVYVQKTLILLLPVTLFITLVFQFIKYKWK